MHSDYPILIVGLGIAGVLLSFELFQKGVPFMVVHEEQAFTASEVSGAVLNPYSGKSEAGIKRRMMMYDIAREKYGQLSQLLGASLLHDMPILHFDACHDADVADGAAYANYFQYIANARMIEATALVDNQLLLRLWKQFIADKGCLHLTRFDYNALEVTSDAVFYADARYSAVIFCHGVAGMSDRYFSGLPFTTNRGDILKLRIPELPQTCMYQYEKLRLLPKGEGMFWCGSNYLWSYDNMKPNQQWREDTLQVLNQWLQVPYELLEHICAKRPTTAGQIPCIGWHPQHPRIGICNGLGTKGFSAGPMWIAQFVEQAVIGQGTSNFQPFLEKWLS